MTQSELLSLHVDAMFLRDDVGHLLTVNEPWDQLKPAPLMYLGVPQDVQGQSQSLLCLRADLPCGLSGAVRALYHAGMLEPMAYQEVLSGTLTQEICYAVPEMAPGNAVRVTQENIRSFVLGEFEWLKEEIATAQPCCVYLGEGGHVLSVCRSVRIAKGHEAGIETLPVHRGKGYAGHVLRAWACAVRGQGGVPLYSTELQNHTSQRLAQKHGLIQFATGFMVWE